jgi:hypothetical protein
MPRHARCEARGMWSSCLVVALSLVFASCTPPSALDGVERDAGAWPDVSLPDAAITDGLLITLVSADGGTTAIDPAAACAALEGLDASVDAEVAVPVMDASIDASACPSAMAPGDLVFDEVMIATEPGSDDRGQWLEVRSTRSCTLDLIGLHASALHGQSFRTMDVTTDTWLPAGAYFLIADTTDPTENNSLPGLVLAWAGSPADALHKTSDVITLSVGTVMIDALTYPSKTRPEATSYAFPWGCAPGLRTDFANWRPSTASWTAGLFGTPGAPNTDVVCNAVSAPMCTLARRVRRP